MFVLVVLFCIEELFCLLYFVLVLVFVLGLGILIKLLIFSVYEDFNRLCLLRFCLDMVMKLKSDCVKEMWLF